MAEKTTVYDVIRDRMIDAIDKTGNVPWKRNWRLKNDLVGRGTDAAGNVLTGPVNLISRKQYTGVNIGLLSACNSPVFATMKQWSGLGCTLKYQTDKDGNLILNEKGEPKLPDRYACVFYTKVPGSKQRGEDEKKPYSLLRYYGLYSVDDVNMTDAAQKLMDRMRTEAVDVKSTNVALTDYHALVEFVTNKLELVVKYGNPALQPSNSCIYMPNTDEYQDGTGYYYCQSFMHEMTHWAGAPAQLDRASVKHGNPIEEMTAEIGSQFLLNVLCIQHGIDIETIDTENSAAYVAGWRRKLVDEPNTINLIMRASSEAQRRTDYILSRLK